MPPRYDLRYELKYLLRREQVAPLVDELRQMLSLDAHGGPLGTYPITSLYYDTPDYQAYWDKLDGHRNRRKIRVRVYGDTLITPQTPAFLEIKQRIDQMMRKRRLALTYSEAVDFEGYYELGVAREEAGKAADRALLHEVYYLYSMLQLQPACVVTYDRMAFEGDAYAPDLRITLDTNLRGRSHNLSLLSPAAPSVAGEDVADHLVLGPEYAVLEVKSNYNVPRWVALLLARHRCTFYRISKYCMVLDRCSAIAQRQRFTIGSTGK
jgi:hypothetical protein